MLFLFVGELQIIIELFDSPDAAQDSVLPLEGILPKENLKSSLLSVFATNEIRVRASKLIEICGE